jgi:tellurite resistance protein
MLARTGLDPHEALVCTMVLVAAADGAITDREIGVMAGLVQTLPVFQDFSSERLQVATALSPRLRETAYALACDVVAAEPSASQPLLRMMELVKSELELDPLVSAAIERGTRARYRQIG